MTYLTPGDWPVSYAGAGCSSFAAAETDSGVALIQAHYEEVAIDLLWNLTKRRFGTRTETVWPERVQTPWRPSTFEGLGPASAFYELGGGVRGYGWMPVQLSDGAWTNLRCGLCGGVACTCRESTKTILLPGPVVRVDAVTIDGVVLDDAAYRLRNGYELIRQDGEAWPTTQDAFVAPGSAGTWSIEFTHGIEVPKGGQTAAAVLACELFKAANGDKDCQLPKRLSSVARQGVVVGMLDAFEGLDDGKTGIWLIDSWVASVTQPMAAVGVVNVDTMKRPTHRLPPGYVGGA